MSQAPGTLQARSADDLERDYLQCLIAPDGRRARQLVEHALAAGVPAATIYLRVIVPAMHEIGRLWETAQLSVAQEHLATQITQAVIASLGLHLTAGDRIGAGRVAIASSTPGELHALAGQIVADFLEAQGWTVLALGADVPAHELVALAHEREAQLVALSTALPGHLLQVTRTCQLLRQLPTPPYIVAGGRAYGGDATRARAVGADAFADDPEGLLAHLREHFAGVEH